MKISVLCFFVLVLCNFTSAQDNADVFDVGRKGSVEQANKIYKKDKKAFDVVDSNGFSPLILACYRGNNEVAKYLIDKGCGLNINSPMGTALMASIVKGNNEIAKLLISKKAEVNSADTNGVTALIYAVQFQNPEMISVLLTNNADKTHVDNYGKTAFEYAVFSGNEEIINILK
jgi:uncharacterized protein